MTNNGVGNPTLSADGVTVDNSGKLGKCYSFNGSTSCINITYSEIPNILNGDFSICMWIYNNDNGGRSILFGSYGLTGGFFNLEKQTNNKIRFYWNGNPDYNPGNAVLTTSAWTHLIVTRKDTLISVYINGVLTDQGTYTLSTVPSTNVNYRLGRDYRSDGTAFNGKMNDFRIYDHALSPNEIEILSRGLVVHYPMTGGIGGQSNLIPNSSGYEGTTGWGNSGLSSVTVEDCPYGKCIKITSPSTASARNNLSQYITSTIGTNNYGTYTLSFYYKAETTNVRYGVGAFVRFANTSSPYNNRFDSTNSLTLDGQWHFCSITQDISNLNDTGVTSAIIFLFAYQGTVWYSKLKLELGTKSTPYVPYSGDNIYTSVGYNDNIEYDVSGYLHNATCINTSYSSDAARYPVSTVFNKTAYLDVSALTIDMTQVTFAVWFKITSAQTWSRIFDFGSAEGGGYCFGLAAGINGKTLTVYGRRGSSGASLPDKTIQTISLNTWYHAVITLSGTTCKCYVNGTLIISYEITSAYPNSVAFALRYLGKSVFSADKLFDGNISDFRIYATCLSADQVKRLYNTPVSLSNNGTLLTQGEFVET